jgi:lysophospholipase L1-like esterase
MNLPHVWKTEPRGPLPIRSSPARLRVPHILTVILVWLAEFVVFLIVAEAIAGFFLPPGLVFYYPQKLMQPSTTRIYEPVPNQRAFTMDKLYITNSDGFRDEREVPLQKQGELRILSLGDSIAEGLGVATEDTYARQLEASLRGHYGPVRVINAGVGGYAAWQSVALLKDKGLGLQPEVVFLEFFLGNNIGIRPRVVTPLPPGVIKQQNDARITIFRSFKRSRVLYFLRERLEIAWRGFSPTADWTRQRMLLDGRINSDLEKVYGDWRTTFEEFVSLGQIQRFTPVLIVYPLPEQVRRPEAVPYIQQQIETMAQPLGLHVIDLLPALRQAYTAAHDIIIPWDNVHLTPRGHHVVAASLERYLVGAHFVSLGR